MENSPMGSSTPWILEVSPKLDAKERSEDLKDLRQGEVFPKSFRQVLGSDFSS